MTVEFSNEFIFGGAILAAICILSSVLSRRLGAPLLLVFLVLGMLAGEDGPGGIQFSDFGLAFLLGNLALALIIFDGGLGARKETFRVSLRPALTLATLGVLVTVVVTGIAAHWIFNLSWQEGLLIGAIVGSTDAAAVFGLLRGAGKELKERTSATLEIESGTNDPMAIFLTIAMVEWLVADRELSNWMLLLQFIQQMGLGLILGCTGGFIFTWLLRRLDLSASLVPLLALAGGLSAFGLTNLLGGSGFLAIYIVGFMIGNAPLRSGDDIHRFHDGVAWLCQIGMFLMLGLLVTPSQLPPIILPAIGVALVLIFVARPLAVAISLAPFHFPWREQTFIAWCGLRGAVPIILALFPLLKGMEHSALYFELAFFVVLISLSVQGWTIAPMAKWLNIELPPSPKSAKHLTLPVPQQEHQQLVMYQVLEGSTAVGNNLSMLSLPKLTTLLALVRNGKSLFPFAKQTIKPHLISTNAKLAVIVAQA